MSEDGPQAPAVLCWSWELAGGLQALTKGVKDEELQRAKRGALSSVLMNLESRAVLAEDIGRQILTYGHR